MSIRKIKTWTDLKKFANSLPEKELQKDVIWWGEEKGGKIESITRLKEDYVSTADCGCEPLSVLEDEDEWDAVYKKGTPIINIY